MKRVAIALVAILLITSCSSEEEVAAPASLSVPTNCADTKILEAFPEKVPNAKYIPTDWEPAEGTDLYAAYNAGGIACSFGIQEAEVGATILWGPDYGITFSEREAIWIKDGQKAIDLPDLAEDKAYVLTQGKEGDEEFIVWGINLLIEGIWIQVNGTFFESVEEAMPLVRAAVDSLLNPEEVKANSTLGCYFANVGDDLFIMNINYHENTTVSASLGYKPYKSDPSKGLLVGNYTNGILQGIYTFESEGMSSERELFFKRDGDGFIPASGPVELIDGKFERFQRPLNLTWDAKFRYSPGEECSKALQGIE